MCFTVLMLAPKCRGQGKLGTFRCESKGRDTYLVFQFGLYKGSRVWISKKLFLFSFCFWGGGVYSPNFQEKLEVGNYV